MNKAEQREAQKVMNTYATHPAYAAATLATLMRSTRSNKTFGELSTLMHDTGLREHMEVVNGCFVAKAPARASIAA